MQKSFAAITLVLTLTCALAAYTPYNHAIAPVTVADDNDFNFTNTSTLSLASITPGDIYLVSGNFSYNHSNLSASYWNLWYRKLDSKTLASGANKIARCSVPLTLLCYNNYAIGFDSDNETGTPQIRAYQVSLTGNAAPSRLTLSANTNVNFTPIIITGSIIKKTVYIFYYAAYLTANITNFVVGSSTVGTPVFTLSTTFDRIFSLSVAWGEALGSNQLVAVWIENGFFKESVLDVSKGTVSRPTIVASFNKSTETCGAYATDKKLYGTFCVAFDPTTLTLAYYVRTNTRRSLVQYANYTVSTSILFDIAPYGPYLAVMFQDLTAVKGVNYAYEIWDLDAFRNFKNRTLYLNIDSRSIFIPFQVPSGCYYTLLYNKRIKYNGGLTSVKVGILLDGYASNKFSVLLLISLLISAVVVVAVGVYYCHKKRSSKLRSDEKLVSMVGEKLMSTVDEEEQGRARRGL